MAGETLFPKNAHCLTFQYCMDWGSSKEMFGDTLNILADDSSITTAYSSLNFMK
jgi:hypothetical protein